MNAANYRQQRKGFTLVEILVVLVIIAVLMIGAVPFISRAQADARDDKREADIAVITAAIERYYQDTGEYPTASGSSLINSAWSTTADSSWSQLSSQLVPKYVDKLPGDPSEETGKPAMSKGLAYDYFASQGGYCGRAYGQMFLLIYNFENRARKDTFIGDCTISPLHYSGGSNYRVARDNT